MSRHDGDAAATSRSKTGPHEHGERQQKRSARSRLVSGVSRPRTVRLPLTRETDQSNSVGADFAETSQDHRHHDVTDSNKDTRLLSHQDNPLASQAQDTSGVNKVRSRF